MPTVAFGHTFADDDLLRQALTHRSSGSRNNERLEYLGDALIDCVMAEALFRRWPRADEGALTRGRAALVRESSLAEVARRLGLGDRIALGAGELKSGGHRRDSILADALEAVAAAVYLDAGFDACRERVLDWFAASLESLHPGMVDKDAKTRLQEWLQARQILLPEYELVDASGEEHARTFRARCAVAALQLATEGEGASRRAAEQAAAIAMLEALKSGR